MSDSCNHDCSNCSSKCDHAITFEPQNKNSNIKTVIAVVSGKGGVGKSSVSALLASYFNKHGKKVALLDADITGPSIPKAFGIVGNAVGDESGVYPAESPEGIKVMSLNLLMEDVTAPVVWRGPVIASCVKQFWTDVNWGDNDIMFIDIFSRMQIEKLLEAYRPTMLFAEHDICFRENIATETVSF